MEIDQMDSEFNGREEVEDDPESEKSQNEDQKDVENEECAETVEIAEKQTDPCRVQLFNLPIFGFVSFKKFVERHCKGMSIKRAVLARNCGGFVSFETGEDAQKAVEIFNGMAFKKNVLKAKLAIVETPKFQPKKNAENVLSSNLTARASATPWADMPYDEQLKNKQNKCIKILYKLHQQIQQTNASWLPKRRVFEKSLLPIQPSPRTKNYRNKCEFTVGLDKEGKHCLLRVDEVDNIGRQAKAIASDFEKFVEESGLPAFENATRSGYWKLLTVREMACDVMLMVTVHPLEDKQREDEIKEKLKKRYLNLKSFNEQPFRVTSIYWCTLTNTNDPQIFQHVGGTEYVYESVLDCRFRISPSAFFQTNTAAANVLYRMIGQACGLDKWLKVKYADKIENPEPLNLETESPPVKQLKLDGELEESKKVENEKKKDVILMDICCGTGTIGICLLKEYHKRIDRRLFCLGVELIEPAIADAKQNARDNQVDKHCYHVAGRAEETFKNARYFLPPSMRLDECDVIGVLDPPRAGLGDKLMIAIRGMSQMSRLVYVSCDPQAAMKNMVDLCKPKSRKFDSEPFKITAIQPVDMFPQTNHVEWVITMER